MTQRVTVSLPDDVAARLEAEPNASAFVAEVVRHEMAREANASQTSQRGTADPEARERARQKLREADQRWTPERWEQFRAARRQNVA